LIVQGKYYEDKVAGNIPESLWKDKYRKWMDEESKLKAEIKAFGSAEPATTKRVKEWIEHAKALSSQYVNSSGPVRRKMVELVGSNIIYKDENLKFERRKPWTMLPPKDDLKLWWRS